MTFQFEMILIDNNTLPDSVVLSLKTAISEGLIIRIPDDSNLKHLGKTYAFNHLRTREAILDNITHERKLEMHRLIAVRMESLIKNPDAKSTFTIAHHLNQAISTGQQTDINLAERGIHYNIQSGHEAKRNGSWLSAQRYFENAYFLSRYIDDQKKRGRTRVLLIENLADVAVEQTKIGLALNLYSQLLKVKLSKYDHSAIAYKVVNLLVFSGHISLAVKEIHKTFHNVGFQPKNNFWQRIKFILDLLIDQVPLPLSQRRLFKLLRDAHNRARLEETSKKSHAILKLLQIRQNIELFCRRSPLGF